jgi:ATP-binding cassette subfamily B protein
LRRDAFARVMALSIEQTDSFTTGSLVTRMTNDVAMIVEFVEMLIRMFVRSPMFLVGGTVMLLSLNGDFGIVLLCSIPVMLLTLVLVLSRAVPMYSAVQKKLDRVNSVVQENVSGARVVKAYTREEHECARFGAANDELCDVNLRVLRLMAVIQPVLTVVLNFSVIAVVYIGGSALASGIGGMTTGTVMAGVTFVTQVVSSLMMVGMMFNSISRAAASAKRVREVLATEPVILGGKETEGDGEIAIAFDRVCFAYPDGNGEPILSDITLDIKRGEMLAIIGETGCGKTSLVNLIPRFYDPTEGEVRIDGVPLRDYDLAALRKKIAYVTQKSELFSGSIADNIRWGDESATDEDVRLAARVAQADEYISHFPLGYDTPVAEKGASLSGGQKQRLSIARALCRRPEILILDDATSALDLSTEAKLRRGLSEHLADTTVVMIAQRIASVREADRIAVLEGGRITHCAPHEELLRISDTYREIYVSQSGKEVRV